MAIIVVGGNGKDVGKTQLACAVIAALREFEWTAVKITGHDYAPSPDPDSTSHSLATVIEETRAGQETDTARYLAAGARRALLVNRAGNKVPIAEIRSALGNDRNVIFESNRIVEELKPDLCLALVGGNENKPSFESLVRNADAIVSLAGSHSSAVPKGLRGFQLASLDRLPDEMVHWMKLQLSQSTQSG